LVINHLFLCANNYLYDFSILGFGPDAFNSGNSLIDILFEGDSVDFISYPYISLVTDCNGDTIATGSLSFFGQLGQTVQSYPVTGDLSKACLPFSVEFVFSGNTDFETDTCILILNGTTGISESSIIASAYSIFPNPSINEITIQSNLSQIGTVYLVYDYVGKLILTGRLDSESTVLNISDFSNGIYFFKIGDHLGETIKVVKE